MLWQMVEFLKDKSIASVPKPWIRKINSRVQCYWPKNHVETLRKKSVQAPLKKNQKNMYTCKILLQGETFHSFQDALAMEKKLTERAPMKSYEKPSYIQYPIEVVQPKVQLNDKPGDTIGEHFNDNRVGVSGMVPTSDTNKSEKQLNDKSGDSINEQFSDNQAVVSGMVPTSDTNKSEKQVNDKPGDSISEQFNDNQAGALDMAPTSYVGTKVNVDETSNNICIANDTKSIASKFWKKTLMKSYTGKTIDVCNTSDSATNEEPVISDTTPVISDTTPVISDTTPVISDTTPVISDTTPVISDTTPVISDTTPVISDTTLVISDTTPVIIKTVIKSSEKTETETDFQNVINMSHKPSNVGREFTTDQQITPIAMALDQPVFTENSSNVGHHQFLGDQRMMTTDWEQLMDLDQSTIASEGTNVINNYQTQSNVGREFTTDQQITPIAMALDQPVFTENSSNVGHHQFLGDQRMMTTDWEQSMDLDQSTIASEGTNVINNNNEPFAEQPMNAGHQFSTKQQVITPDLWMDLDQPMFTEASSYVGNHQFIIDQQQNTENQIVTDEQIIVEKQINVDKSTITTTEPFIPYSMIDGMITFEDYLELPIIGMDLDLGFANLPNSSMCTGIEHENSVNNFGASRNEVLESAGVEEIAPENIERARTTLNNVVDLLANQETDNLASEITYVLKPNDDGSVEVELLSSQEINQGAQAENVESCNNHESANSYQTDSAPTGSGQLQHDNSTEYRIHHLGSNNYQDSMCYLYTKNNGRGSNLYLRCKNSVKHRCPARVTLRDNNFANAAITIGHNHPPDQRIFDGQIFDKKLGEIVDRDPFLSPRQIYLTAKTELKDKIDLENIPSLKKKEGFIYRRQRKYIPLLPSTIDDFEKYIVDEKYRKFFAEDHRNLPYFRGVWTSKKGERNLVFISETILKMVNTMNHISFFMDGTYKALPHHIAFRQLYVISVTYENECYPLAYIFMEKKTFTSYDTIFQNLKFMMPSVEVVKVMTDYEAATRKALMKHYPNARIAGCFFHYVQAIVKSTKRFGLRSDERFKAAILKVCCLALLPNEFVVAGFESIHEDLTKSNNIQSTRWERFRKYWLKQWGPANISVYGLVDRSNNFSESNNKSLNLLLMKSHPNIWFLIKTLKLLEMDKSDKMCRAVKGEMFKTKQRKDLISFNEKVAKATKLFDEDQDVRRFLQRVTFEENVELFVKDQVNIMDHSCDTDIDDENDEEVVPNHYDRESDFRKNHRREAVSRNTANQ